MKKQFTQHFKLFKSNVKYITFICFILITNKLSAATYEVSNLNNDGTGSLRQAILDANTAGGTHVINFVSPVVAGNTIDLTTSFPGFANAALGITCNLTINGPVGGIILNRTTIPMRVLISTPGTNVTLNNLIIQNGAPVDGQKGGGLFCRGTMSVQNCIFRNNSANTVGNAIYIDQNGDFLMNNTIVENNIGTGNGAIATDNGAPFNDPNGFTGSKLMITNSLIQNNTSSNGGGIYSNCGPGAPIPSSVSNTIIRNNTAEGEKGGGISVQWGTIYITNCEISGNTSVQAGGGIGSNGDNDAKFVVTNCTISGNTAPQGGGIFTYNDSGFDISNTTISGNTATDNYGGMFTSGGTSGFKNLMNVTVTNNNCTNTGGAGFIVGGYKSGGGDPEVEYSIFCGNTTANSVDNKRIININGNISSNFGGNIFGNELNDPDGPDVSYMNNSVTTGTLYPTASPSTILDPTLADNGGVSAGVEGSTSVLKTHALVSNSPAINIAGGTYTLESDQRGLQRDANEDAGAFEVQSTLSVSLNGDFNVKQISSGASISWSTLSEKDNNLFIVDRSTDGINYTLINEVKSKGNNSSYSILDSKPVSGTNYYRLSQIDLDGTKTVLATKTLNFGLENTLIQVYPNPTTENIFINLGNYNKNVSVKILNLLGNIVYSENLNGGANNYKLNIPNKLANGIYLIKISGDSLDVTKKIVVK